MNQLIHISLIVSVLSFPIVFFLVQMRSIGRRTRRIIEEHSDSSSIIFVGLTVWFKNLDVFRRNNKFDLDPYEALYSFNSCDLILNDMNIVVIGNVNMLGKEKPVTSIIFEFVKNQMHFKPGHVSVVSVYNVGDDLEIEFSDPNYKDRMTFVIKRVSKELNDQIQKRATTTKFSRGL